MKYFRKLIAIFFVCISVFVITAKSDYEYLLNKYKNMKEEWLETHPESEESQRRLAEKAAEKQKRLAEKSRILAEKKTEMMKAAEYLELLDAYLAIIPEKNYLMMKTEVTQKQWQTVMEKKFSWFKGNNFPVERVSWIDAVVFCNRLSEKEGLKPCYSYKGNSNVEKWKFLKEELRDWSDNEWKKFYKSLACNFKSNGYRLPTLEEWQYAARGGENYKYSGSDILDEVGWYAGNSRGETHPVAQKKANGYGLYDMSGNVLEWCWDSFNSVGRYICGGCWNGLASYCEVGNKDWDDAYGVDYNLGFRVVRSSGKK